jgi:hypothetical protein|tara:strand:+ start:1066 stop:1644 length:579 start_codon:yes stop_codon:yes gene_type:complete
MNVQTYVIDNFYNNPDEVRQYAMEQDFQTIGNFPGKRTSNFVNEDIKQTIQNIIKPAAGNITNWETQYNGCYQLATSYDRSWIHCDATTGWAGVLFLTPNAPLTAGTAIYRHKETGLTSWKYNEHTKEENNTAAPLLETQDFTKWDLVDSFANVYNRLILYRGENFHTSLDYFGTNLENGRLFQTFFFDTEY